MQNNNSSPPPVLANIRIVLAGTLYSGNVGSVCRAMANMGLRDLVLAAPKICDDGSDAGRLAVHAGDILANSRRTDTLEEALADCAFAAATTARIGLYRQHAQTPREAAPELLGLAAAGGRVALVFGPEDKGLTNEEILLCSHLITIPVDPAYTSLNLSQAALICCYELYAALGAYQHPREKSGPAALARKTRLLSIWREMLLTVGFFKEDKADHMMQGVHRIFSRGVRTDDDVSIMMGIARQAQWAAGKKL